MNDDVNGRTVNQLYYTNLYNSLSTHSKLHARVNERAKWSFLCHFASDYRRSGSALKYLSSSSTQSALSLHYIWRLSAHCFLLSLCELYVLYEVTYFIFYLDLHFRGKGILEIFHSHSKLDGKILKKISLATLHHDVLWFILRDSYTVFNPQVFRAPPKIIFSTLFLNYGHWGDFYYGIIYFFSAMKKLEHRSGPLLWPQALS